MLAMNNCISQSTKKTPYEMVFGQPIRNDHDFWYELHKQSSNDSILNEEDIPEPLVHQFNLNYDNVSIKILSIIFIGLPFFFHSDKS